MEPRGTITPTGRFEQRVRIRFGDCDPAGIVFYPRYLVLFNGLVEDWITEALGIPYAELIGTRRTGLPTVALEVDFRAISRLGDNVRLGLQLARLGTHSFTLELECRGDTDGALRVEARKVIVTTDLATHQSIAVPGDLRAAITRFASRA